MKVGNLVISNDWFPGRKEWNQKRVGLVIEIFDDVASLGTTAIYVRWSDQPDRISCIHTDWLAGMEILGARRKHC